MINNLVVLQSTSSTDTVQDNGADCTVDNKGMLNIYNGPSFPAVDIQSISIQPAYAEQIQKATLTFTSANSTQYQFIINGYSKSTGAPVQAPISYTSPASSSTNAISAAVTLLINALTDLNVSASDSTGGVIVLTGTAAAGFPNCPNAPTFYISESDSNIAVTAAASAACTAAPAGGRTAVLEPVMSAAGVMTSIRIVDGGEGYITAPTITIANGAGAGSVAPTAVAVIFEGTVIAVTFTAGTAYTYTAYKGFTVFGTGAAIQAFYGYNSNVATAATAPAFPSLASLTAGYNYTQVTINYAIAPVSGITTFTDTVSTRQVLLCIYESATNVATLLGPGGTIPNLQKGFRVTISAGGANYSFANSSGGVSDIVRASGSLSLDSLKVGDIVWYSASSYGQLFQPSVILAGTVSVASGIGKTTGDVSAAAAKLTKRFPISL